MPTEALLMVPVIGNCIGALKATAKPLCYTGLHNYEDKLGHFVLLPNIVNTATV